MTVRFDLIISITLTSLLIPGNGEYTSWLEMDRVLQKCVPSCALQMASKKSLHILLGYCCVPVVTLQATMLFKLLLHVPMQAFPLS